MSKYPSISSNSPVVVICDSVNAHDPRGFTNPIICRAICEDVVIVDNVGFANMAELEEGLLLWPRFNRGTHTPTFTRRLQEMVERGLIT